MHFSEFRELVMDREAWRAAIHGVTKSQTRLSHWSDLIWYPLLWYYFEFLLPRSNPILFCFILIHLVVSGNLILQQKGTTKQCIPKILAHSHCCMWNLALPKACHLDWNLSSQSCPFQFNIWSYFASCTMYAGILQLLVIIVFYKCQID